MSEPAPIPNSDYLRVRAAARAAYARRKKAERAAEALLTPWFNFAEHRPARVGVYRVQDSTLRCGCCWIEARWNGREWHRRSHFAPEGTYTLCMFNVTRWRGLRAETRA